MADSEEAFVAKAIQNYKAKKKGELSFKKDCLIQVTKSSEEGMLYYGRYNGKEGWFPYFYVKSTGMTLKRPEEEEAKSNSSASAAPSSRELSKSHGSKAKKSKGEKKKKTAAPETVVGDQYVLKSGMLGKLSGSKWKQRWIVLRSNSLMYYRSAVDTKTQGKISTKAMRDTGNEAGVCSGQKYCFYVATTSKKKLVFAAPSLAERDEWVKMIDFARKGGKPIAVAQLMTLDAEKEEEPEKKEEASKPDADALAASAVKKLRKENMANKRLSRMMGDDSKLGGARVLKPKASDLALLQNELQAGPGQRDSFMSLAALADQLAMEEERAARERELGEAKAEGEEEEEDTTEKAPGLARVRAVYEYVGRSATEFSFQPNDEWILLQKKEESGWWLGEKEGHVGHFPSGFVEVVEVLDEAGFRKPPSAASPAQATKKEAAESSPANQRRTKRSATLLGDFQLGEPLGKGAFGMVYRGINVQTGEMVAVKQIELSNLKQADLKASMAELELLKELDHENIVKYKTFTKTAEHLNIVLEFVEGGSLASIVSKFGTVPDVLAVRYIKQILDGLNYLHSKGVIHRDIKCGNILITKDGTVKLADFGIATRLNDTEAEITGSPYWMAPEVIELRGCTPAADIWALGATIVELLTGSPPYMELNKMQAMFRIVEDDQPPIPDSISPVMRQFLLACFKKDPAMRSRASELMQHRLLNPTEEEKAQADAEDDFEDSTEDTVQSSGESTADVETTEVEKSPPPSAAEEEKEAEEAEGEEAEGEEEEEEEEEEDEEAAAIARQERQTRELLGWFTDALDKGHVSHAIRIRKAVRDKLKELKVDKETYKDLIKDVRDAMNRCEDEMGEHIPIDSDDDDDEFYSSDSSGGFEEDEEDPDFDFRL